MSSTASNNFPAFEERSELIIPDNSVNLAGSMADESGQDYSPQIHSADGGSDVGGTSGAIIEQEVFQDPNLSHPNLYRNSETHPTLSVGTNEPESESESAHGSKSASLSLQSHGSSRTRQTRSYGKAKRVNFELYPSDMTSYAAESSHVDWSEMITHNTTISTHRSGSADKTEPSVALTLVDVSPNYQKPAYTSPAPRTNVGGDYIKRFIHLITSTFDAQNTPKIETAKISRIFPLYMTAYAQKVGHMAERFGEFHPEIPFIYEHIE
jgi:hypothetical protein